MVWFQCEDCGENLKKPKLPNHFRICSAFKLSCIDCGEIFDRQSVQAHTQCITEAEKYGPKGQAKAANGTPAKPSKDKPKPDVDINVGLSTRPPWFCSLCNTKATSQQTLLLHADGKKHRAKARAHAAAQQPKPSEESTPANKDAIEKTPNNVSPDDEKTEDKENGHSSGKSKHDNHAAENGNMSAKKRKVDSSNDDGSTEKAANELNNGNVIKTETEQTPKKKKKAKGEPDANDEDKKKAKCETEKDGGVGTAARKEGSGKKIKWKKLITTTLKSAPDGVLKMKKLQKRVLKSLNESGVAFDDSELSAILERKVNSSSKFTVDGKYIRLAV